jgi:hypothetical protein
MVYAAFDKAFMKKLLANIGMQGPSSAALP